MPSIVWFRRDYRLHDHAALHHACRESADGVVPVFVFDDAILRHADAGAAIVAFMLGCLRDLRQALRDEGGDLILLHGDPGEQLAALARATAATSLHYNRDYHPAAIERDDAVTSALQRMGVKVRAHKDQVVYEERELLTASAGEPFTVYSPYARAWRARLAEEFAGEAPPTLPRPSLRFPPLRPLSAEALNVVDLPTVESLGFRLDHPLPVEPGEASARKALRAWCADPIRRYKDRRDFPADPQGTSRLSPHLRHGTLSPRQCLRAALHVAREGGAAFARGVDGWIGELIWREFYQQILFNFPRVVDRPFRSCYDNLAWADDEAGWLAWRDGRTGYPIVDAGMRQLNSTGWMHNRLRMIVAMFLTKDLGIDYRRGERYFMQRLIDGETAQNNGGWQWSASTGTDAQPYFRIFNPFSQSRKFDPDGRFLRAMLPELRGVSDEHIHAPHLMDDDAQRAAGCVIGRDYPAPIVDHARARERALAMFRVEA